MKVYVVSGSRGVHKVGIAEDVRSRVRALQSGSPTRLRVLHELDVGGELAPHVEAYAHWLLRDRRASGEWFKVDSAAAIAAVTAAHDAVLQGDRRGRSGVGRPKMDVKPTLVRLPEGVPERIDALCGPNKRADFIRQAVERELKRRERKKGGDQ